MISTSQAPRESFLRVPRWHWLMAFIAAAAVFDGVGIANYLATVLWLDRVQQVPPLILGLVASLSTMVYSLTVVACGSVADRVGVRRMTCLGASTMALANLLMLWAADWRALVLGLGLKGIAAAVFWPAMSSWMGRGAPPSVLAKRVSAYNLGWCGGQLFGLALAGWLYRLVGGLPVFGIFAVLCVGLAGAVWLLPDPARVSAATPEQPLQPSTRHQRLAAWVANFASYFVLFEVRAHFAVQARLELGWSETAIGLANASIALVQVSTFYYFGLRRPDRSRGAWLVPSLGLAAVGLVVAALGGGYWLLPMLPVIGLMAGVSNTASLYHSVSGRADAATQSGIHETVLGVAMIIGPIVGGAAAQHFALAATWWLGAVLVSVALVVVARLHALDRAFGKSTPTHLQSHAERERV